MPNRLASLLATFAPAGVAGAAILAAAAGASPSMAQSGSAAKASLTPPTLTKEEITELSGLTVAARRVPSVSELTVTVPLCPPAHDPYPDAQPPKLVSSYPSQGATVRPGILILRLTFDRAMNCAGLLNSRVGYLNPCSGPLTDPLFSRDRRTFLTVCIINEDKRAVPAFKSADPARMQDLILSNPYGLSLEGFAGLSGHPLKASNLDFFVNPFSAPVRTIKEAMTQDRFLRDAQKAAERPQ